MMLIVPVLCISNNGGNLEIGYLKEIIIYI